MSAHQLLEKCDDFKKPNALKQVERFLNSANTEAKKSFFGYVSCCSSSRLCSFIPMEKCYAYRE